MREREREREREERERERVWEWMSPNSLWITETYFFSFWFFFLLQIIPFNMNSSEIDYISHVISYKYSHELFRRQLFCFYCYCCWLPIIWGYALPFLPEAAEADGTQTPNQLDGIEMNTNKYTQAHTYTYVHVHVHTFSCTLPGWGCLCYCSWDRQLIHLFSPPRCHYGKIVGQTGLF